MRIRVFHFAILLLAATAIAQDTAWTGDPIDPDRIAEARQEIEKGLTQPAKDASEDEKAWYAARARRIALLSDLERAIRAYRNLPVPEENAQTKERLERELGELRASKSDPLPPLERAADLAPLEAKAQETAAADEQAKAELERLQAIGRQFEKGIQNAATRISELRKLIDDNKDATAGSVQAYRATNAQIEIRLMEFFSNATANIRQRIDAAVATAQVARDISRLRADRALKRLEAGRELAQRLASEEADALRDEAKRLEASAKEESDPLRKALIRLKVRRTRRLAEISDDRSRNASLKSESAQRARQLLRDESQIALVERRLQARRAIPSSTADLLNTTLVSTKADRREVEEAIRRNLERIAAALEELGPVQETLWSLEGPIEQLSEWQALEQQLPPEARDQALAQFTKAIEATDTGLLAAVRARVQSLEHTYELLNEIDSRNEARAQTLQRLEALITSHLYWVRTDPRIGFRFFKDAWDDLGRLHRFYADPEFHAELDEAMASQPGIFGSVALALALLFVGTILIARRIRARPMHRPRKGEHLRTGIRDGALLLLHAAAPSLVLLLAMVLLRRVELPLRVTFPLQAGLRVVAFLLFVQRLTGGLLSKHGYLIAHFGVSREVGRQILRSVRLYTVAGMVLWLPHRLLGEADVDFADLRRLFGTSFRYCELLSVALLLPRQGPVARSFVNGSETGLRILGIVNPVLLLLLVCVAAMDFLGFRYGAIFFTGRVMVSIVAIVILRAFYAGLNQISERVAQRVRERAFREQGGSTAWEDSSAVTSQLTRLITVGFIVAATLVLGQSWRLGSTMADVLGGWQIAEFSDGVTLTAGDVGTALLFIVGAHFVSSNIAGIFELVVFPVFGKVQRGTRFVVLALSRYFLLLVGYGAALISLHFSVANLGWLLAAASVGLGFGLQEIVANFVSGLILLVERPVRVGDIITVGDTGGTVESITIRSTVVTNWDQQQIIIPNKAFITQNLTNWTRNNSYTRRRIPLSVAYGSDVETVFRVIEEVVKGIENVRTYPPPRFWFDGFGESSLEFVIWIYVDIEFGLATMTEVRRKLLARLGEEGIRIPFPQRDVHLHGTAIEDLQASAGTVGPDTVPEPDSGS